MTSKFFYIPPPFTSPKNHNNYHHHSFFFPISSFPFLRSPSFNFHYTTTSNTVSADFQASAYASSSAGADQYSDQQVLLDSKKKKKKRIAGVEQDELVDPMTLADSDSCFCEFKGVQVHYKISQLEEEVVQENQNQAVPSHEEQLTDKSQLRGFPMILLHGFGASLFSWNRVLKPLTKLNGSKVIAFDRPAFGLTSRGTTASSRPNVNEEKQDDTQPLNPYSMAFSVLITLQFINLLAADKTILFGHSAGSLVAVNTYFEAPERIAALILVAPAIFAPPNISPASPHLAKQNEMETGTKISEERDGSSVQDKKKNKKFFARIVNVLSNFFTYIGRAITVLLKGIADMVKFLYKKALTSILRSSIALILIRMVIDKFGVAGIRNAWYDASQISDHILEGYTKPLKIKGWDRALLEFTATMLDSESESKPPLARRLNEISCPVLIITGDSDRIVPSWNAERLSKAIPHSSIEIIRNCGHLPQEEKAEEFISIVQKFLQKIVLGTPPDKEILQAASA